MYTVNMFAQVVVASALISAVVAAPLAVRDNTATVFNGTYPADTVFGPFSAIQKFDPQNSWFTGCGYTNYTGQYVASIKSNNTYSNTESCGKTIEVTNSKTGAVVVAMIVDECLECAYDYLRLSPAAYDSVADDRLANFTGTYVVSDKSAPSPAWPAASSANVWPAPSSTANSGSGGSGAAATPSPSSSSSYKAPSSSSSWTPSSSSYTPAWTPSSSSSKWTPSSSAYQAPATTQQAQQQQQNYGGGSYSYSGTATWFTQNGNAGACGQYHGDYDYIVALDSAMYGGGAYCGRRVTIKNNNNGKTVTATVADECPTCVSSGSLDLSLGAFQAIGSLGDGVEPISWSWA